MSNYYNDAFGGYMTEATERDEIVNAIVEHYRETGDTDFNITVPDDITESDLRYIRSQVSKRLR